MEETPTSTSNIKCRSCGETGEGFKHCGRCKKVAYCSITCQKKAWKTHKWVCVSLSTPRHKVDRFTVSAIQNKIDSARPGEVIEIPAGTYSGNGTITIKKPLHLLGEDMDDVIINADLKVADAPTSGGTLVVANLSIEGIVDIHSTSYGKITFQSFEVSCPPHLTEKGKDAFSITHSGGKILLSCCEIIGGSDGVMITGSNKVHITETDISYCSSRGIFANDYFVIEDSCVYNCGSYGIKGRAGWDEKGENQIQPGPWDSFR